MYDTLSIMKVNKKYVLIILSVLLLSIGIYYSYITFNGPIKITETKDSPFSILLENEKETFEENTDWYEAKIVLPKNNKFVSDQLLKMWSYFEKENELKKYKNLDEAKVGLRLNVDGLKYGFNADYKIVTASGTITYIYTIHTFTGGAHGATSIYPISFNNRMDWLQADRILSKDLLEKVSALAYEDLLKQKKSRLTENGMTTKEVADTLKDASWIQEGTVPTRDNYNAVWYEGDDLVIAFQQYQIGPYAEGVYEVRIPLSKL